MQLDNTIISQVLYFLALQAIYLGAAGLLGELIYHLRRDQIWAKQALVILSIPAIFIGLAFLPGWSSFWVRLELGLAACVAFLFALRPFRHSVPLWQLPVLFRYLSITLILIGLWAFSMESTGVRLFLVPFAGLAALMAWLRARRASSNGFSASNTVFANETRATPSRAQIQGGGEI
jgi:hypothetical protein